MTKFLWAEEAQWPSTLLGISSSPVGPPVLSPATVTQMVTMTGSFTRLMPQVCRVVLPLVDALRSKNLEAILLLIVHGCSCGDRKLADLLGEVGGGEVFNSY